MPDGLSFSLFVLAAIIFLGGFALGTQWNVRKGDAALKWFREGLPLIGEKSTMRWLGSSVLELKIQKAKDPFRNAETLVVFEPRDVVILWGYFHARGRRDLLIFRAQLRSTPSFEMESYDPGAWTINRTNRSVEGKNWRKLDSSANQSLTTFVSGEGGERVVGSIIKLAGQVGGKLVRISVHRTVPNLEVHWHLPKMKANSSRDWFTHLRQIGEETLRA